MSLLNATQLDALQEVMNIGVGRSAMMLNRMLGLHVILKVPIVKVLPQAEVQQELEQNMGLEPVAAVRLKFSGSFDGVAHLVFPPISAAKLVTALTNEEIDSLETQLEGLSEDLDAIKTGTLSEVGNIVLNSVMGEMSNLLHQQLKYSIPAYLEEQISYLLSKDDEQEKPVLLAQASFLIERLLITGDIVLIFSVSSFNLLLLALENIVEVEDG